MTTLTWFINKESGNYFLLDPIDKTLNNVNNSSIGVIDRYKHLMGVSSVRHIYIPDYSVMKKFQKTLKTLDLSTVEGDIADCLVNSYPEYFI